MQNPQECYHYMVMTATPRTRSAPHGIFWMMVSVICFSAMSVTVRHVSAEMPSFQMVFLRNFIGFLLMLPWLATHFRHVRGSQRFGLHFARSLTGIFGMELWFYALSVMPVPPAIAISFMTPIFVTLGAILFFGERVGKVRWAAIAVSFLGMLIITRPGTEAFSPHSLVVLAASFMWAVSGLLVKNLSRTETPATTVFYMNFIMTFLSLPLALWAWKPVPAHDWLWLALIASSSTAAQLALARAYSLAEASLLMSFDFTRLIFTAGMAYMAFGEVLDIPGWIGAGVIAASAVLIAHREARAARLARHKM